MIGVFDSGVGGMTALRELRRLLPREDLYYLADRENAPYGTKSEGELIELVARDVRRLRDLGAERVLMACCTASTVWASLPYADRLVTLPIIQPTAQRALRATRGHIAVIATEHTVRTRAFSSAIDSVAKAENQSKTPPRVTEIATQELVTIVERGERDEGLTDTSRAVLDRIAERIRECRADTLILGCTHFSHLRSELEKRLPRLTVIGAAEEGAGKLVSILKSENRPATGNGRTVYL